MRIKKAVSEHPVQHALADRWRHYGFEDRRVAEADLLSLFEAARWAAAKVAGLPPKLNWLVMRKVQPVLTTILPVKALLVPKIQIAPAFWLVMGLTPLVMAATTTIARTATWN